MTPMFVAYISLWTYVWLVVYRTRAEDFNITMVGPSNLERMYTLTLMCTGPRGTNSFVWYKDLIVIQETLAATFPANNVTDATHTTEDHFVKVFADYEDSGEYTCELIDEHSVAIINTSMQVVIIERPIVYYLSMVPVALDVILIIAMVYLFWKFKVISCGQKSGLGQGRPLTTRRNKCSVFTVGKTISEEKGIDNTAFEL